MLGLLEDMDKNRVAIFRALTTLRQLALDPGLVDPEHAGVATSAKITLLLEHVVELASEGHRALVFSSFTSYLALVRQALEARGVLAQVRRVRGDLYGSLALTGRGHATDKAVLLGLSGERPDTTDPDAVEPLVARDPDPVGDLGEPRCDSHRPTVVRGSSPAGSIGTPRN